MSSEEESKDAVLLVIKNTRKAQTTKPNCSRRRTISRPATRKKSVIKARREQNGEYQRLCEELELDDEKYFTYFRMSKSSFEELHEILRVHIRKHNTNWGSSISSRERLTICLRYLASGITYQALATSFLIGRSTVSNILNQVCSAIWDYLRPYYMSTPREETWRQSAKGYYEKFTFPNCIGSIDGKQIKIDFSGKKSLFLLAIADAYYKLLFVEICELPECMARDQVDSEILEKLKFYQEHIVKDPLLLEKPLPGTDDLTPHVLISNEGFGLKPNLLRPFPEIETYNDDRKRRFNDRINQAWTPIQHTFEIMFDTWKVLCQPLEHQLESAINVVKAICCLHNFLCVKHGDLYGDIETIALDMKHLNKFILPIKHTNQSASKEAKEVCEQFVNYFYDYDDMKVETLDYDLVI